MKRLHRLLAARRLRDERGITLIEITVVVFLFGLVSAVVMAMFVSVIRGSKINNKVNLDTRSAANGMNEMARMIRAATENPLLNPAAGVYPNDPSIIAANTSSIKLYAYVNLDSSAETPVIVQFWVNTRQQLVETKWLATTLTNTHWNFSPTAQPDRILADSVIPGSTLFRYFAGTQTPLAVPTGGIVDATARQSISSVQVTFSVKSAGSNSSITMQNTVGMPNLGLARTGTGS
jgi:type II secretory pathway pseudopilin PulG